MTTAKKTKSKIEDDFLPPEEQEENHLETQEKSTEEEITLQDKFKLAREDLATSLVDREDEIDLAFTAMLSKKHLLLIGTPGVAKSLLLDSLIRLVDGGKSFSILFSKFTTPEEVFGPISIQSLKEDKYKRVTTNKLPEAHIAMGDEIFKSSSAIRNSLLRILNERVYENGDGTFIQCPLLFFFASSNEYPSDENDGKESGAIFDRFLLRKTVNPVSKTGRRKLLSKALVNDPCKAVFSTTLTPQEIDQAHQEAMSLPWTNETKKALWEILENLNKDGIFPGDRRIYQSVSAARASAYLQGAKEVLPQHLEILSHVLWEDPQEQPAKCEKIIAKIANPLRVAITDLQQHAQDVEEQAEKQLENMNKAEQREGVIQKVLEELEGIRRELVILQQNEKRDKVISWVNESIKDWRYKLIRAERS